MAEKPKTLGQAALEWEVSPDQWLPLSWRNAVKANVSVNVPRPLPPGEIDWAQGAATYNERLNAIRLGKRSVSTASVPHEYAHAAWFSDLTDAQRREFAGLHDPSYKGEYDPKEVRRHIESFAPYFAAYVVVPSDLKKAAPAMHEFFRKLTGRDYSEPYESVAGEIKTMNEALKWKK